MILRFAKKRGANDLHDLYDIDSHDTLYTYLQAGGGWTQKSPVYDPRRRWDVLSSYVSEWDMELGMSCPITWLLPFFLSWWSDFRKDCIYDDYDDFPWLGCIWLGLAYGVIS